MSDDTTSTQASTSAWDSTWEPHLSATPPDFESATLENQIDGRKLEFLGKDLPQSGRAVEVGCGSARLLARVGCAAKSLQLTAVDNSENALRLAEATANKFKLQIERVRGDVRNLPLPNDTFDLMLSGGLLEHFEDPKVVLSEMVRVLKPGALFYADVVPRKFSLYRRNEAWRMLRSVWMLPNVYESALGPRWYRNALTELGCTDIRITSAGIYPRWSTLWWARQTERLDGTALADAFGWYFMIAARKR